MAKRGRPAKAKQVIKQESEYSVNKVYNIKPTVTFKAYKRWWFKNTEYKIDKETYDKLNRLEHKQFDNI